MSYITNFKVITPPAIEPITVAQVKQFLRIDWPDEDVFLQNRIVAARRWLEQKLRKAFITQTLQAVLNLDLGVEGKVSGVVGTLGYPLELPHAAPLQSVSLLEIEIQIESWQALTAANPLTNPPTPGDYLTDLDSEPGRIWLAVSAFSKWAPSISYPTPVGEMPRFRATYLAGFGNTAASVPQDIQDALLNIVVWSYENRGAPIPEDLVPDSTEKVWHL